MGTSVNKKCKSFTSLEQSKKLAEILPLESADMFWPNAPITVPCIKDGNPMGVNIPAWSLTALLGVLPKHIKDFNVLRIDIDEKDFAIWYDEVGYGVNTKLPDITMKCPVDACYEMILY